MNKITFEGKWTEIKGEVQKAWGTLTNDDLERAKGNAKTLIGVIQQRVGKTQDNVESKVQSILHKFNVAFENSDRSDTHNGSNRDRNDSGENRSGNSDSRLNKNQYKPQSR